MTILGNYNRLPIIREATPGLYLDGGELGEILLPRRYTSSEQLPGEHLNVFVYRDSEDRLVATTETPKASVGEFAALTVTAVHERIGVFLDWGLAKDLLLPKREQSTYLRVGDCVVVRVIVDEKSHRIIATTYLNPFLNKEPATYPKNAAVSLLIAERSEMGYKAIVEKSHWGLLYQDNLSDDVRIGETRTGYIQRIRDDGKIDLTLSQPGFGRTAPLGEQIVKMLQSAGGFLPFHDKSSPESIQEQFGTSKKAFKQTVGVLLKKRRIAIEPNGIRLVGK